MTGIQLALKNPCYLTKEEWNKQRSERLILGLKMIKLKPAKLMSIFSTMKAFCALILFISSIASAQGARQGGITGGGGHLIPENPAPILMDLYELGPKVQETYQYINKDKFSSDSIDTPIDMSKISAMPLIEQKLKMWETSSPRLIEELKHSIKNTKWYATPFYFKVGNDQSFTIPTTLSAKITSQQLIKIAYYNPLFEVWLSRPIWNRGLGDLTKAGIIIHEALRQMQLRYEAEIKEEHLQKITAYILLATPGQWLPLERRALTTLDLPEYLGKKIVKEQKYSTKRPLRIKDYKSQSCRMEKIITSALQSRYLNYFGQQDKNTVIQNYNALFCQSIKNTIINIDVKKDLALGEQSQIFDHMKYCESLSPQSLPFWKVDFYWTHKVLVAKAIEILKNEKIAQARLTTDPWVQKNRKLLEVVYQNFHWLADEKIDVFRAFNLKDDLKMICSSSGDIDDEELKKQLDIGAVTLTVVNRLRQFEEPMKQFEAAYLLLIGHYGADGLAKMTKQLQDVTADLNKVSDSFSRKNLLDYIQDLKNKGIITE